MSKLLEVKNLSTHYFLEQGLLRAVEDMSFSISAGETVGLVGESGCGKSVTARSIMRLLPPRIGRIVNGEILFHGGENAPVDIAQLPADSAEMRRIRGDHIGMIFQEPMTSLNPVYKVGAQIVEAIRAHRPVAREEARSMAIKGLEQVGITEPEKRVDQYPQAFSGGMRQRAMIAMALACNPDLLIADEPTTAVDVTVEAQILALIDRLQTERNMAVLLITHDLNVVGEIADKVIVMYLGRVVETTTAQKVFDTPTHPYTQGLLNSLPAIGAQKRLEPISGSVPGPHERPSGCAFAPRCARVMYICQKTPPTFKVDETTSAACWLYDDGASHEV